MYDLWQTPLGNCSMSVSVGVTSSCHSVSADARLLRMESEFRGYICLKFKFGIRIRCGIDGAPYS